MKKPNKNILGKPRFGAEVSELEQAEHTAGVIEAKLEQLGVQTNIERIKIAPQTIRFAGAVAEGVQVRHLPRFAQEIQYELGAESVRIDAPIPGEKYIGIEISNPNRRVVRLSEFAFNGLEMPLGIDQNNEPAYVDIRQAPHFLVAGTTGSGKSTSIHGMILSILMSATPDEVKFVMIDTKQVELTAYEGMPHLLTPVIEDAWEAVEYLQSLAKLMDQMYGALRRKGYKNISEVPKKERSPYIVLIIDEVADLVLLSKYEVEDAIVRIAQKARAVGIHMILATQTPRRDIISGLLKANLPSRLGFATASSLDSRIILGQNGCESLLGKGDLLYSEQGRIPKRVQAPYVSHDEIKAVVEHWKPQKVKEKV